MICSRLRQIGNFGPSLKQIRVPEHSSNAERLIVGLFGRSPAIRLAAGFPSS